MASYNRTFKRIKMNLLGPTGLSINVLSFIMNVLGWLCTFRIIPAPVIGAILGILALVAAAIGLTMAVIARNEIVINVQRGDELAISGMVVGIVMCTFSASLLAVWFILYT